MPKNLSLFDGLYAKLKPKLEFSNKNPLTLHRHRIMKRIRPYLSYIISISFALLASFFCAEGMEAKDFVVVIDAGHGGHDPGAVGNFSQEKEINLKVALKLGKLIGDQCPGVKVIYTREKDVFLSLNRRAAIANNAKADLFISIHTNALPGNQRVRGTSTWTLGLAKSDENLEVAKRENAVILYEDDYRTRYAGFDPNSSESYIIFEFMQDKYMSQSVHLASLIQQKMKTVCRRNDHGVHQAGFLVLKASAMPSVLIELGYISTPSEERYLNSENGSSALANGIFQAFQAYRKEQGLRQDVSSQTAVSTQEEKAAGNPDVAAEGREATAGSRLVFKVQVMAVTAPLPPDDKRLKGMRDVDCYQEGGWYKYTCGVSADYNEMVRLRRKLASKFKGAFIVAFKNGKKMDINEAIEEFLKSRDKQ